MFFFSELNFSLDFKKQMSNPLSVRWQSLVCFNWLTIVRTRTAVETPSCRHQQANGHSSLLLLIQHLVDQHVVVIDRYTLTQLLFVSQRDCVRLPLGVLHAALQVGVVEALPPAQPIPGLVKAKAWHQDQVQTSCQITRSHQ